MKLLSKITLSPDRKVREIHIPVLRKRRKTSEKLLPDVRAAY
jgi:hypothetical protein